MEHVTKALNGLELGVVDFGGCIGERGGQLEDAILKAVFRRDRWHCEVLGAEGDRVSDPLALCGRHDIALRAVPVHGGADAPPFFAAEVPGVLRARFVVRNNLLVEGTKGCCVAVKGSVEILRRRDAWVERGLAEEVEVHDSLRDEEIPQEAWEVMCDTRQHSEEVCLEGAYGAIRGIATVHVGGDELELGAPSFGDLFFICGTGLVVENL